MEPKFKVHDYVAIKAWRCPFSVCERGIVTSVFRVNSRRGRSWEYCILQEDRTKVTLVDSFLDDLPAEFHADLESVRYQLKLEKWSESYPQHVLNFALERDFKTLWRTYEALLWNSDTLSALPAKDELNRHAIMFWRHYTYPYFEQLNVRDMHMDSFVLRLVRARYFERMRGILGTGFSGNIHEIFELIFDYANADKTEIWSEHDDPWSGVWHGVKELKLVYLENGFVAGKFGQKHTILGYVNMESCFLVQFLSKYELSEEIGGASYIVGQLSERGNTISIRPFNISSSSQKAEFRRTPTPYTQALTAVHEYDLEALKQLVAEGFDVNTQEHGCQMQTVMHMAFGASFEGTTEEVQDMWPIVDYLIQDIDGKADINLKNSYGKSVRDEFHNWWESNERKNKIVKMYYKFFDEKRKDYAKDRKRRENERDEHVKFKENEEHHETVERRRRERDGFLRNIVYSPMLRGDSPTLHGSPERGS